MSPADQTDAVLDLVADASVVAIVGDGDLADEIRRRRSSTCGADPDAVVVTTGDAADVAAALERVQTLGTVVVVGGGLEDIIVDVYGTIHLRGLRLVGVDGPPRPIARTASPTPD